MSRLLKPWPQALSAALLLLAFPPFKLEWLVFVALVPWLMSLASVSGKGAWKSGYLFGLIFGLGQFYFVAHLAVKWTGSWIMGSIPAVLASLAFALYFGWAAVLIRKCFVNGWVWAIPLVWAGIEAVRSFIPTFAFPWGLLAMPLWNHTQLVSAAHFGMIFLISGWVVLANLIFVKILALESRGEIMPYAAAFGSVIVLSLVWFYWPVETEPFIVTDIQPGVDFAFGEPPMESKRLSAILTTALKNAASDGTALCVMPEGVLDASVMPPKAPFPIPRMPVIVGGHRGTGPVYQSAFGFNGAWKYVDKTRLVVFGEYVPARETFPFIAEAFKLPTGDLSPGKGGVKSMNLGGVEIGPIVCFEAVFPEIAWLQAKNGSRLLAVISVDDWYMGSPAPDELMQASVWRSIETGLPLVRSASLGYSIMTDTKGRLIAMAPLKEPRAIRHEMQLPKSSRFFALAPVFPAACALLVFLIGFWPNSRRKGNQAKTSQ
jgi:apolipoprotein N-acyltransferase